ncbi:MAG: hypothetical protein GY810_04950 [Aureispira sp.]|nr:hypothetical protein [Aureispira sp.]
MNILFISLLIGMFFTCTTETENSNEAHDIEHQELFDSLELKIATATTTFSKSESGNYLINAQLLNNSTDSLLVVLPGEGSVSGWRTPIMGWSIINLDSNEVHSDNFPSIPELTLLCANVNQVTEKDLTKIAPASSASLSWIDFHRVFDVKTLNKVGTYSIKLYYKNTPDLDWEKIGYLSYTEEAAIRIKNETQEFMISSNEIIIKIIE